MVFRKGSPEGSRKRQRNSGRTFADTCTDRRNGGGGYGNFFSGGIIGSFYEEKPVTSGNGRGSGRDGGVGGHSGKPGPAHGAGTGRSGFHNAVADGACLFSELWGMFLSVYASSAQRTLAGSVPCM